MRTNKEIEEQFKKELSELLKKWNTEIGIEDDGIGYASDYKIKCYIPAIWDDNNNIVSESAEIDFGGYIDSESK